jgi:proline dehydrogenase
MKLSTLLLEEIKSSGNRAAFATHDEEIINLIIKNAETIGIAKDKLEFQMLYGIKPSAQKRLTASGCHVRVLISYGEAWFPWYMRRLAERPANVTFVLKNMFQK